MTSPKTDFDMNFGPSPKQIAFALEYTKNFQLDSVFVPVNFPGKQRGVWVEGQARTAIPKDADPVIWVQRERALQALTVGQYGDFKFNALFRVWADGLVTLVDEA